MEAIELSWRDKGQILYNSFVEATSEDRDYENLSGSHIMARFDSYRDSYEDFFEGASEDEVIEGLVNLSESFTDNVAFNRNYRVSEDTGYPESRRDAERAQNWMNNNPHEAAKFMEGLEYAKESEDINLGNVARELNEDTAGTAELYKEAIKDIGEFLMEDTIFSRE